VRIQESFTVPRAVPDVWAYLLDVERVAPCMPGAELTETIDDTHWKGLVNVTFGPMTMTFRGTVALKERDESAHRVLLAAKGMEQRGKGAASASITASLAPVNAGGTDVSIDADITLSGAAAQLSRGLLPEVSKQLTARFADCLRQRIEDLDEVPATTTQPVGGLRLGVTAVRTAVARWIRRLFGGRTDQLAP
jgi:carbon monoxide dehydrogenase subunit G